MGFQSGMKRGAGGGKVRTFRCNGAGTQVFDEIL